MSFYNYRVKRKRSFWRNSGFGGSHHQSGHHHHHHHHHRHRRRRRLLKRACIILAVLLLVFCAGAGGVVYLRSSGKDSLARAASSSRPDMGELEEGAGIVSYNGERYKYNEEMLNILCLGIDQYTAEDEETEIGENGQADTIFLLTLNQQDGTMKLIGISRDTMTLIQTYDHQGNYVGESVNHLGLAYAFGDGGSQSGELMTEAVSGLLYDLPIHGYAAIRLDAIQKINDAVGGVAVTLPEDMVLGGSSYSSGERVTLMGAQAQSFVQSRNTEEEGSNNRRMERQKQYALAFIDAAKTAIKKQPTLAAQLYRDLTEDMVTSIGIDEAVYLASLLPEISFDINDIGMLVGETKQGAVYEEFYIDEEALLDVIFDTFYIRCEMTPDSIGGE